MFMLVPCWALPVYEKLLCSSVPVCLFVSKGSNALGNVLLLFHFHVTNLLQFSIPLLHVTSYNSFICHSSPCSWLGKIVWHPPVYNHTSWWGTKLSEHHPGQLGREWLNTILQLRAQPSTAKMSSRIVEVVPRWMDLQTWAWHTGKLLYGPFSTIGFSCCSDSTSYKSNSI